MAAFVTCSKISKSTVSSRDKRGRRLTRRPQLAMSRKRGNLPFPGMKKAIYSMKTQFESQLRLDLWLFVRRFLK
jgi:hypothetical protein